MSVLEEHERKRKIVLEKTNTILGKKFFIQNRGTCKKIYEKVMIIIKNHGRRGTAKIIETNLAKRAQKEKFCIFWTTDGIEIEMENGSSYTFFLNTSLFDCFSKFKSDFPDDIECNFFLKIITDLFEEKPKEITLIIGRYELKARKYDQDEEEFLNNEEIDDVKCIVDYLEEYMRFNMKFGN